MATVANGGAEKPPRPKRIICFSFAAYATTLIHRLKSSNVVVSDGISDAEFSNLESKFGFAFPPDLRAILQQGLPISPGFPNWRSSSPQQLQILLNLPTSSLLRRVSTTRFWHPSWGPEPFDPIQAIDAARRFLKDAPILVPIYRHCYIPSSPNAAGNPVFYVDHGGEVRLLSFDVAGFFRRGEFMSEEEVGEEPVWAAKMAKRIEVWSEMAKEGGGGVGRWWWRGVEGEVGKCMEGAVWKLREGGWKEEEIREMMMVMDGGDDNKDKEGMTWHAMVLSSVLLRAGWSREEVVDSLGVVAADDPNSWLEFYHQKQHSLSLNPS